MAITSISRDWGYEPALVRVESSDTMATVLGSSYITDQADNIAALNNGPFKWLASDAVLVKASDGWAMLNINSAFTALESPLNGAVVDNFAPEDSNGGLPLLYAISTAGGATATETLAVNQKITVVDAWVVLRGAGTTSDTIQVKNNAGTAITDAMDISGSDKDVVRAGSIDDAARVVDAGDNLQFTETDGGGSDSPICDVYVLAYKTA